MKHIKTILVALAIPALFASSALACGKDKEEKKEAYTLNCGKDKEDKKEAFIMQGGDCGSGCSKDKDAKKEA